MDRTDYDFEYDYEDEPAQDRILWGRIAILGFALLLVFVLGRCTAGGGDSTEELADLESQVAALVEENSNLRAQVDAYEAGGVSEPEPEPEPAADDASGGNDAGGETEQPDDDAADAGSGSDAGTGGADGQTHEVAQGESLYAIAERYYGSGEKFTLIAEANGLSENDPIQPGLVLQIPPDES